jgi:hypothetical protein
MHARWWNLHLADYLGGTWRPELSGEFRYTSPPEHILRQFIRWPNPMQRISAHWCSMCLHHVLWTMPLASSLADKTMVSVHVLTIAFNFQWICSHRIHPRCGHLFRPRAQVVECGIIRWSAQSAVEHTRWWQDNLFSVSYNIVFLSKLHGHYERNDIESTCKMVSLNEAPEPVP